MKRRMFLLVVPVALAVLAAGGYATVIAAQNQACRSQVPAIGTPINTTSLPFISNFDPCTNRLTMTDDALKRTGGPYISRTDAEARAVGRTNPTKVRSYFVSEAQAHKLVNDDSTSTWIYPDREEWVVVVQAPDQGPEPSLPPNVQPWPRRWFYVVLDATTGAVLSTGGNGQNDGDWPSTLPAD